MANIPINDISLNDIHVAVGGTHQTEVSLNDTDIRNATGLTLNATYSDLHGTGIDATDASTISIHEFRNAEYGVVYSSYALTPESVIKNETNDRQQTFSFVENNSGGAKTFIWRIVSGASDFTASSGSFSTVFSGAPLNVSSQSFTVEVVEDNTTEGTESFTLEVALSTDTGYSNVLDTATIEVTDTSLTPASATYAGSFDVDSIDEDGSSAATFTVTTANVSNGTNLGYTISGTGITANDISLSSLTGTITINNNTGSVSFTANADATTEGAETLTLALDVGSVSDTVVINDTSTTPAVPTYVSGIFDVDSIDEDGSSAATFTVTTANVSNGATVEYTITGVHENDISLSSLTGTITINNNTGSVSFTANADATTEDAETVTLTLASTDSNSTATESVSDTVVINDTSTTPAVPTYAGSFDVDSIDEDGSSAATFTVTTANVSNGSTVEYTITGVSVNDISLPSLTGTITINNNTGSVSFTANADATTEGAETLTLALDVGSVSDTVVINDTSLTASDPVTSAMDVYPLHSTNSYTVSISSIVSTVGTTAASRCEGYLMVEESGSDIIVYAAGAGTVLTGVGNSSTVSISYKSEGTTNTSTMTAIPETGTDYSNRRECFRLNDIASAGWTVKYSLSEQVAWETSPTGRAITFVANHSTVDDNFDGITTSAQGVTSGSKGKRALWFGLTTLSGTSEAETNQQNDGSVRLTFSKSGETDRVVDTQWSLQATATSQTDGFGGGGLQ
jgi:hypothetical protein